MSKFSRFLQSRIFWIQSISISLIALCLVIGFSYAWNAPTCDPTIGNPSDCNVSAPLNVGTTTQTKTGELNIMNKVGIGTTSPQHLLHLYETNGNAELDIQSVSGANNHWAIYNERIGNSLRFWNNSAPGDKNVLTITDDGKVGIGATTPGTTLQVDGPVKVGSYTTMERPTCDVVLTGAFIFDTTESKPYVCNGSNWKPLDSDYDKDGLVDWKDVNDNDATGGNGLDNLKPENIKKDVVINGVKGILNLASIIDNTVWPAVSADDPSFQLCDTLVAGVDNTHNRHRWYDNCKADQPFTKYKFEVYKDGNLERTRFGRIPSKTLRTRDNVPSDLKPLIQRQVSFSPYISLGVANYGTVHRPVSVGYNVTQEDKFSLYEPNSNWSYMEWYNYSSGDWDIGKNNLTVEVKGFGWPVRYRIKIKYLDRFGTWHDADELRIYRGDNK